MQNDGFAVSFAMNEKVFQRAAIGLAVSSRHPVACYSFALWETLQISFAFPEAKDFARDQPRLADARR
jgi:hypothetical protein